VRADATPERANLGTIARAWTRLGMTGFGGPPAHLALLRRLCVEQQGWLAPEEFGHAVATANLLPGPASTQVAIYCAWRVGGPLGGLVGGCCFILPGLIAIIALSAILLSRAAPAGLVGAAAGAASVVAAIAVRTGLDLLRPALQRSAGLTDERRRIFAYGVAGALATVLLGPWLVVVLLGCGALELLRRRGPQRGPQMGAVWPALAVVGTLPALVWTAIKVGALSFGGGFVIIPLLRGDAVTRHHWLTAGQFLEAVALGQLTPGPVVQTVAVIGYGAAGLLGAIVAAVVAFAPSFLFVLALSRHFERFRTNVTAAGFFAGAGPAAIGAILGSSVLLVIGLTQLWQGLLAGAAFGWLVVGRRSPLVGLGAAAAIGAVVVGAGWAPS